ncbi:protein cramped [Prorops nasuta]|uniref:protein cramped n=1 Tax=Prorops nasuta TaxID=863751 RepID=UPI0034CEF9F0
METSKNLTENKIDEGPLNKTRDESENQMEQVNLKKEETQVTSQITQTVFDSKTTTDTKNTQVRLIRGTKRFKADSGDPSQTGDKKDSKDEDNAEAKVIKSLKRSCELWSMEDKSTFFKALNEYGKDFDALQSYFLSQGKKKGLPENTIKNKEQIRHFYYRTWLKISKNLKFSEDVKKTSQELYGLINYGELRRKLPRLHEKVHLKLNELVYWGSTQVRLRGKTMRIKTPICRALRKLNQLEDWQEEIKLPSRITIELKPKNNMAWWQVQAASMNPRVRTLLPIQRRISSLISFLQQRWRPPKYRDYINIENLDTINTNNESLLRVAPPTGCKIALPMVNLGEYLTSNSVSLNSYEKRLGLKSSRLEMLGSVQYLKGVGKKGIKRYKLDKKAGISVADDSCNLPDNNSDMDIAEPSGSSTEKLIPTNNSEKPVTEQPIEPNRFPGRETIERIQEGWNIDEANSITVGDLYLMFGRDSKISLEYWWDSPPLGNDPSEKTSTSSCTMGDDSLRYALQKLLSLAKHSYGTNKFYENASGSNETVVSSRVPSTKESTFRRPLNPQVYDKMGAQNAFKTQLDKFKTRFCKRGRTVRQKSLVVQRVPPVAMDSNKNTETLNAINDQPGEKNNLILLSNVIDDSNEILTCDVNKMRVNHFLETLPVGEEAKPSNSIITSATQILKEGENQWLNSEVADFSLSSFLGQLDSPIKISQRSHTGENIVEDTRPSSDVVSHMQCLMGENTVDYMAKFANLASQIADDENKK